jgi:hypothetical protein
LGKGTQAGLINEIGFGQDFLENKYLVTTNLQLTSNGKIYIPIPRSKLRAEEDCFGMLKEQKMVKGTPFGSMN